MAIGQRIENDRHLGILENKLKLMAKSATISGLLITFILHIYTAISLALTGAINDSIPITLSFDFMFIVGCCIFWIFAGKGQFGRLFEWLAFFIPTAFNVWSWTWINEQFNFLEGIISYFPINSVLMIVWMILFLFSALYLIFIPILALIQGIIRLIQTKNTEYFKRALAKRHLTKKSLILIIPIVMIVLAVPVTSLVQNEGNPKRILQLEDTNTECTFCIWDFPNFSGQVGDTQDIDLNQLSDVENRTLMAFGKMNTTFYGQIHFDTEKRQNETIALMKTLEAYNCSACCTVWYDGIEGLNFPGPLYPENWIAQARKTLEFIIDNGITNVVGICMDSESQADIPPEEYWENIQEYDDFLQEVQTNTSLLNPNPHVDRFETVLCFSPLAVLDLVDGDNDLIYNSRRVGLPPSSWTEYHFMQYRMHPSLTTTETFSYNVLNLEYLGADKAVPIVGLAGVEWFAEGYFENESEDFGFDEPDSTYDGVDGWEAMKREILFCKAQGFKQVSVFKLYSYNDPGEVEDVGMFEYYGIEKIEELADEWNQPKTIEYPIYGTDFKLSRAGFFQPFGDAQYDYLVNTFMYIVRWIGVAAALSPVFIPRRLLGFRDSDKS